MCGLLLGTLSGLSIACKFTGPEGIANGTQSLYASEVLASHHGGLETSGYEIPRLNGETLNFRNLSWVFTQSQPFVLPPANSSQIHLTSLTSEDLLRTQDPYYCAMRWNYGDRPSVGMKFFANRRLLLVTQIGSKTRAVVARIVEWGPPVNTVGGIALSAATLSALGISPGDKVGVAFEANNTDVTGPIVLGVQ
jgi:hypothetical protein